MDARKDKVTLSAALGITPQAEISSLEFVSPMITAMWNEKLYLGFFINFRSITMQNIYIEKSTERYHPSYNFELGTGLALRSFLNENVGSFVHFGPNIIFPDPALANRSQSWGLQLSFGAEYLFTTEIHDGDHIKFQEESLFAEIILNRNVLRADKLTGSPSFFNYQGLALGVRWYI